MTMDQESTPAQIETNKTKIDDAQTLKPETETSSKNSPPSPTNKPDADDQKTSKQDAESVSSAKNVPQAETQTDSHLAPSSQTNKPETDDSKALKHDPESGPSAKNIPQTETQTSSKNSHPSETNKPETDDSKALKVSKDTFKHSPPKDTLSQTTPIAKDSATDAYSQVQPAKDESTSQHSSPPVQDVLPAGDEAMPRESSPPKNGLTQMVDPETRARETLKQAVKKCGNWEKVRKIFRKKSKGGSSQDTESKSSTSSQEPRSAGEESQIRLIQADINYVKKRKEEFEHFNKELTKVLGEAEKDFGRRRQVLGEAKKDVGRLRQVDDLNELRKDMMKLKLLDPSKYKKDAEEKDPFKNFQFLSKFNESISKEVLGIIPQLHKEKAFETSMDFKDFEARYNQLSRPLKLCLLCFSIFPGNFIIRKRLMVQWWVSEGFVESENDANKNLNQLIEKGFIEPLNENHQLIEKGFIEPFNENRSPSVRCCTMHPFYRSALAMLAERARFFSFNDKGDPTQKFSKTFQSCLVGEGLLSLRDLEDLMSPAESKENKSPAQISRKTSQSSMVSKQLSSSIERKVNKSPTQDFPETNQSIWEQKGKELTRDHLEKLHLLINVDEHILDFKPDWFERMKNLNFLYLGRWKVLATDHIEVEDTKFLEGLKFMSFVKLLSLQGLSNIIALPSSILEMANLKILDLRACYNLETIPDKINSLKNLEHLDMSECYLVEHMPKSLSSLTKLKVIKGFVVCTAEEEKKTKWCTLNDLEKLDKLIKLCIYTGLGKFPEKGHVRALHRLKALKKLTITWGGSALQATSHDENKKDETNENTLPSTLEKLDLKCFPKSFTPGWLELKNLKHLNNLEKLYIRGGKFSDLGQYQNPGDCEVMPAKKDTWKVKVLRLKYLSEIKMEWRQFLELFPDLEYLEQVSCPKLTLFPSDANGVWKKKIKTKGN